MLPIHLNAGLLAAKAYLKHMDRNGERKEQTMIRFPPSHPGFRSAFHDVGSWWIR